jgi:hypothetical protein
MIETEKKEKYKDGDQVEDYLTVSLKGGYFAVVYRCSCNREQTAKNNITSNGINKEIAYSAGWVKTDTGWICPFCSGRKSWLNKFFNANKEKDNEKNL